MTLKRWSYAFLQLGGLLLAIGLLPALAMMALAPGTEAMLPVLLSLTVAPLGFMCFLVGVAMWMVALGRPR
ncbi:hypothetical protein [Pelagibacterium sediminicola]|uniref:hypothetical protein n=1 Tax=Pelagibacterium sediminicola TaxID=2248761 RepID=UPI000E31D1F6|nr:hypothetical protein [Pelagibacterium sediminicola]